MESLIALMKHMRDNKEREEKGMKMKKLKRLLAGVMTAAMVMSTMAMTAFAEGPQLTAATIDTTKKGSITIHKYEYNGSDQLAAGTGTMGDEVNVPNDATALDGVTFELYKVMTTDQMLAYYNGTDNRAVTVDTFVSGTTGNYTVRNIDQQTIEAQKTEITANGGLASFTNLDLGMYVVIETNAPDKVTSPADPFLVSVPMTNTDNTNWLYDINVYPKNSTSEGTVELTKTDKNGTALDGVTFRLEKQSDENWSVVNENLVTDSNGKIKCDSLAHGKYRITETSAPAGYIVDQRPIEFIVGENNTITCVDSRACINLNGSSGKKVLEITLINEKPDLTKVIDGDEDTHEANAAIGSNVNYKITVDVPKNIADMKTFVVTDTPTNLQDHVESIRILDGETTVAEGRVYSVSENENGFVITFKTSEMAAYAGKQLTITYSATVLSDAATDGKALNTADLTYSNKIHTDSDTVDEEADKNHIKDEAIVYNYMIKITKYKDTITEGKELPGVEFELYKEEENTPVSVVRTSDGEYRLAVSGDETATTTTTLVTGSNGQLVVKGLTNGTYYLKETKTANGYNLLKDKVAVTLNMDTVTHWTTSSDFVENSVTRAWDLVKRTYGSTTYKVGNDNQEGNYVSQNIINKKGFQLPTTGGFGTIIFSLVGILLMAGGAIVLFRANKKKTA